jgi:hypothetical protein
MTSWPLDSLNVVSFPQPAKPASSRRQLPDQPIHALKQPYPCQCATSHDLPFPLSQIRESKCFRYLRGRETSLCGREVLFVGEHEQE